MVLLLCFCCCYCGVVAKSFPTFTTYFGRPNRFFKSFVYFLFCFTVTFNILAKVLGLDYILVRKSENMSNYYLSELCTFDQSYYLPIHVQIYLETTIVWSEDCAFGATDLHYLQNRLSFHSFLCRHKTSKKYGLSS